MYMYQLNCGIVGLFFFLFFTLLHCIFLAIQQLPSRYIKNDLINVDKFLLLSVVIISALCCFFYHSFYFIFNINFVFLSSFVVLFVCPFRKKKKKKKNINKITMNFFFLSLSLTHAIWINSNWKLWTPQTRTIAFTMYTRIWPLHTAILLGCLLLRHTFILYVLRAQFIILFVLLLGRFFRFYFIFFFFLSFFSHSHYYSMPLTYCC